MSPEIGLVSAIVGGTVACLFGGMMGDGRSKGREDKEGRRGGRDGEREREAWKGKTGPDSQDW